ncbi:hypothetical protein ACW6QP_04140 [Salegentibacter sp. HM20]
MRKLLLLIILFPGFLFANDYECVPGHISYLPESKTISLNPKIIIEGSGYIQKLLQQFKDNPPYLENAAGDRVLLQLEEINVGQRGISQGLFSPTEKLKPNTENFPNYISGTENKPANPEKYDRLEKEHKRVKWTTTTTPAEALNQELEINFLENQVEFYGCGPEAFLIFELENTNDQEIWYHTELVDLQTGESHSYILDVWKDALYVGHGMCSGAFSYSKEGEYKVRFTPMNIDGESLATTDWYTFESPYVGADNPWEMLFSKE